MKSSSDHSTLLNVGLSVLVFMHWSKNYLLVSINCLILLGVVLEAGIDCANTLRLHCSRSR